MDHRTHFALLALALTGCIQSNATADDPERDAAIDAGARDAGEPEPSPVPDPDPGPAPDCEAVPTCPPGYDRVQACEPGAVCETVMACGDSVLCQTCPPGAGLFCPEGSYEVEECTNDGSCFGYTDCAGSISCESCDVCPEGMLRVEACPPGVACHQCDGDGDGLFPICAPEAAVRCPPHTIEVDACLPGDPLCWVLDDGAACLSNICPVGNGCGGGEANPVDACAEDALGCFERDFCGDALTCEVVSHDCDACVPRCPEGQREVDRCAPDGRPCLYIAECCTELFCQPDP